MFLALSQFRADLRKQKQRLQWPGFVLMITWPEKINHVTCFQVLLLPKQTIRQIGICFEQATLHTLENSHHTITISLCQYETNHLCYFKLVHCLYQSMTVLFNKLNVVSCGLLFHVRCTFIKSNIKHNTKSLFSIYFDSENIHKR